MKHFFVSAIATVALITIWVNVGFYYGIVPSRRSSSGSIRLETKRSQGNERLPYLEDQFYTLGHNVTTYRFPCCSFDALGASTAHSTNANIVIVGVLSAAHLDAPRQVIRQTWASNRSNVLFLIAGNWTESIQAEFATHKDLIWIDAPEAYRGITLKVLVFYHCIHNHVPNYHYVIKTDDDSYLRLHALERIVDAQPHLIVNNYNHDHETLLYWGALCSRGPVMRDPRHKWYVSESLYPESKYPHYASGAGYVLSRDLVACITRTRHAILPNEDAFTGILVQDCNGTCLKDVRFHVEPLQDVDDDFLVQHHIKTARHMERLHQQTCCSADPDPQSCGLVDSCNAK